MGVGNFWTNMVVAITMTSVLASACSKEDPAPTAAELLAEIEGRELTPAEVAEKQEVAQLLCGIDDEVLILLWEKMSAPDLEFQDWVFGQVCRERATLYGEATGRFDTSGSVGGGSTTTATTTTARPNDEPTNDAVTKGGSGGTGQSTGVGGEG